MRRIAIVAIFSLLYLINAIGAREQDGIYIIFDASGSMWQKLDDGTFKIEAAKQALTDFMAGDLSGYDIAFRAYGHRRKGDCRDSELIVPFSHPDAAMSALAPFISTVNPTGKTPIHFSLQQALNDFGDRPGELIVITDGIETCDADPCELVKSWQEKNVDIRVHVVGFGLDEQWRAAIECIADAAGSPYHDANSSADLAESLQKIRETAKATVLRIHASDESGRPLVVEGTLQQNGTEKYRVASHHRNHVEPGDYTLSVGVRTINGTLHEPVEQNVQIPEGGEKRIDVTVKRPPTLKAKFIDDDEEKRGANITAFQDGAEVFKFRWIDTVFVDEGTYLFRAQPNRENDLEVTATVKPGHNDLVFEMTHTVQVKIKMVASGSGIWFRENYELWQNGEKKYRVHVNNGARVLPGTYDLHLPNRLTPYIAPGLVITGDEEQTFEITVPVGHATIIYQNADGTRAGDKRSFVGRNGERNRVLKRSGEKHPLTPGSYYVDGWRGNYERQTFEIVEGEDVEVILRETE